MDRQSKPANETQTAAACVRCGQPTDKKVGGLPLCDDCYAIRGSCCPEFGPDDLANQ